jgi:site-specific DNA-methyltransferase (adenine-specific)
MGARRLMPRYHLARQDAVAWLRTLASESIDLLVTDPAYASLEKHRAKGTTTRLKVSDGSSNEWFDIFPNARFPEFFEQVYRVLKKDTHFYMYCDQETMFVAKPMAEAAGFKFWKPIVWDKLTMGMGYHYRARYEFILFFEKGKRKINDLGVSDVIPFKRIRNGYPTQKPWEVSAVLIQQSSEVRDVVVDPFMGSASVGYAALGCGRDFMGTDISAKALALSHARLAAAPEAVRDDSLPLPFNLVTPAQGALFA